MNKHQSLFEIRSFAILCAVSLAAAIESIDMTALNVALPSIMKSFHTSIGSVTWVISAYVLAAAVVTPLTKRLINQFGQKRLLIFCLVGFAVCSIFCAASQSFLQIIISRVLQGLIGASLIPISQYIIVSSFEKHLQKFALGVWTSTIAITGIAGPVVGGLLINLDSWRLIFLINIPIVCIATLAVSLFLDESQKVAQYIDWLGLALMSTGIACLEVVIDRGDSLHWFQSKIIVYLSITSVISFYFFFHRSLKSKKETIIDLSIFKHKKFSLAVAAVFIMAVSFVAVNALLPLFQQELLGHTALLSGLITLPGGFVAVASIAIVVIMLKKMDVRLVIILGTCISFYGAFMLSDVALNVSNNWLAWTYCIRSFGFGLMFLPLTWVAVSLLPPEQMALGSGLYSFFRTLGGSVGINLASGSLNWLMQTNWATIHSGVSSYSYATKLWLSHQMIYPGLDKLSPSTLLMMRSSVAAQSSLMAFSTLFLYGAILIALVAPIVFFFGKIRNVRPGVGTFGI